MKDLHRGTHSQVQLLVGSQLSPPFLTESSVRQRCVLAPSLFCRAVGWVLQESLHHSNLMVSVNVVCYVIYIIGYGNLLSL